MKKNLLAILMAIFAISYATAQSESVITLKTTKAVDSQIRLLAWCSTVNEAVSIDWGDGVYTTHNIDPDAGTWSKWISGKVKGETITVKGELVYFELTEAELTEATLTNQTKLTELDLAKNELTAFNAEGLSGLTKLDLSENQLAVFSSTGMTALTELNLSGNLLTAFDASGAPSIVDLNLSKNQLDSHALNIEPLASSLKELNLSDNKEKFVTLNLINFGQLTRFNASNNPELTTVVFKDGNPNLTSIDMSDCYIMHFYAISLPSLTSLSLSNGALLEFERGDYPELTYFSIGGNYLQELDVTQFPKLYTLACGGNQLTDLNVSNNPELNSLNVSNNKLTSIDLTNNTHLRSLSVNGNAELGKIDITPIRGIEDINISDTKIRYIDLSNAYYLKDFKAANTECEFFYFNYVDSWGQFKNIDIRNNKKMTSNSVNFTLRTLPQHSGESWNPTLLLEGSNAEHADTEYANSQDLGWKTDVTGDGTAKNETVPVTVDATLTGETVTVTGEFGGMTIEQTFTFSEYATENGKFTLSQWSGSYYQQLSDVTTEAKAGVAIHVTPVPDAGYVYDGVTVNGEKIDEEWFVVNEQATVKVHYRPASREISFNTGQGQPLSIALGGISPQTPVQIDWGNGSKQDYTITSTGWTRIDGTAAGTTITVYGDVFAVNFESYGEYGEQIGLWNNRITGVDFSKNNLLQVVNLYMNPITALNISNQENLAELDCSYCELHELNVSGLQKLEYLACYGNAIPSLDLSGLTDLRVVNAADNGMTACELDDFYFNLPQYPQLSDEEKPEGFPLTVAVGTDERPNAADKADSYIAVEKGWSLNVTGDASGCDMAHLLIAPTTFGRIELTTADGMVIKSGDKVKKNSPISVKDMPDAGYQLKQVNVNDKAIEGKTFAVSRMARVSAVFEQVGGVDSVNLQGVKIAGMEGEIFVEVGGESQVEVFATSGSLVYGGRIVTAKEIPASAGIYVVKVSNADGHMVRVVAVR